MAKIECLRDCDAACCKAQPTFRLVYDFDRREAQLFQDKGAALIPHEFGGFTMTDDCEFLQGKFCDLHGKPSQPKCCVENIAGGGLCVKVRAAISGKRYGNSE